MTKNKENNSAICNINKSIHNKTKNHYRKNRWWCASNAWRASGYTNEWV